MDGEITEGPALDEELQALGSYWFFERWMMTGNPERAQDGDLLLKNKRSNLVTMWILASTSILGATPKILSTQKNSLIIHGLKLNSMLLIIIIMYRWYRIASALPIAKGKYVCSLEEHDTLGFRLFKTTANDAHYPAEISNTVRKQENRNRRKMWGGNESTGN